MSLLRVRKVRDVLGDRIVFVVGGPPGTGKSTLCGQMIPTGPTLLIATLPRELDSWLYRKYNVDHHVCYDAGWKPLQGEFNATAFDEFLGICEELLSDDVYDNIIIDNGTELGESGWRKALSANKIATVAEMDSDKSRWLPFDQLDTYLDQGIRAATALSSASVAKRPKNVAITWHVQPAKDDTTESVGDVVKVRIKKASADHLAEGAEYEGKTLPMIRGRFRRRLLGLVPTFVYTDVQYAAGPGGITPRYVIQVRPDKERHTKLPGPLPKETYIANDWKLFKNLIETSKAEALVQGAVEASGPSEEPLPSPQRRLLVRKPS